MTENNNRPHDDDPIAFVAGGGEMGRLIREFDWPNNPLGPLAHWPQSLKTAVSICLDSRFPIPIWWGPELRLIYNDAWRPVLGQTKHPHALGSPGREVWPEIWHIIGPMLEGVLATGHATWSDDQLLPLDRNGYLEEAYFTYSYSPIRDERGKVGGVFSAVNETTLRVIGERRLRTLRELGAQASTAKSPDEAGRAALQTLGLNHSDVPFALLYFLDDDQDHARLCGSTPMPPGGPASPTIIDLAVSNTSDRPWPLADVVQSGRGLIIDDLSARFGPMPRGPLPVDPQQAAILPLRSAAQDRVAGVLIMGVNPCRALDDDHRSFFDLVAGHVAAAVSNARAYDEERRRAEALAELDRAKTAFFSNVSHEFRTPLTLMLGPVEDLLARSHTDLPPAAAGQLEVVNRNGLRLLRLVNSLLDFSRIEAGRIRAVYRPTELGAFTADLASNFRSACERAGLQLVVDCPPIKEPVFVDREMWEKIVLNLLSNAFKFTFEGEIEVSLRQVGAAAELRVRDTGTGIPAEEMPRLFERFHRIENARGRTYEGSGIGLALVHELVKLHGGSVTAESALEKGTTFKVTVPLGSAHLSPGQIAEGRTTAATGAGATPYVQEALRWLPVEERDESSSELPTHYETLPTAYRHTEPDGDGNLPRVLVADDNADLRQYIVRMLSEQFRVEVVPDGETALAAAKESPPDLIVTDVMMPKLNGFGLLKELRADPRTRGLPVIMLSARAGEESRVEGLEAGADDYLAKPFSARELQARVSAHLQMARLRRESNRAIRESEERFRALVNATSDIVYRMSADWTEMHQLQGQEFIPDTDEPSRAWLEKYIHPDDQAHVMEIIHEAVRTKSVFQLEHRVIRADGALGWVFSRAIPLLDANGEIREWFGAASDVSARKQAEQDLQRERDRLRVTLASIGDAVITTDTNGHVTNLNPVAELLTGWAKNDAFGQPLETVFRIVNEATRQPVENPATRALYEGTIVGLANHTVLIGKDGEELPIDDSAAPIRSETGDVIGSVLVFRDVSERRRAEKALRESETRFQLFMAQSPATAYIKDSEGRYVFVNRALQEHFHRPLADWIGKTDFDIFPAQEAEQYRANDQMVMASNASARFVEAATQGDSLHYYLSFKFPLPDGDGHWSLGGMSIDITEQKQAEAALRESEGRKTAIVSTALDGIITIDHEGNIVEFNPAAERTFGYCSQEVVGLEMAELIIPPLLRDDHRQGLARYLETGTGALLGRRLELTAIRKDGSEFPVELAVTRISKDDRPLFTGYIRDITERKRAEAALKAAEVRARFLADASAALAELNDQHSTLQKVASIAVPTFADGCLVDLLGANGAFERVAVQHGHPRNTSFAQLLAEWYPTCPADEPLMVEEITESLLAQQTHDMDRLRALWELGLKSYLRVPILLRDRTLGVISFIMAEPGRKFDAADLALVQDLARRAAVAIENANLYRDVREADRRKDEFLATLAHELRNPLAPLRNALQIIRLSPEPEAKDEARNMMERQLGQMVRLVDDLMDVSRITRGKVELKKEPVELSAVLSSALETSRLLIDQMGHELTVSLPQHSVVVDADPTRLAQAFANLLANAAKYSEQGGRIWLTAERHGNEVIVSVKDTGIGIPPDKLTSIFDMFSQVDHSLEKAQGGLGIGLTLVRRLVEMHNGRVDARSDGIGRGAEFVVRLPIVAETHVPQRDHDEPAVSNSSLRILVVDDNRDGADSLAMMLRIMGNDTATAYDGKEGVAAAERLRPDVVLLDIGLPKLNGYEAARLIREQPWGKHPVLIAVTGWGQDEDRRRSYDAGFDHHMVKPVAPNALMKLLADLQAAKG